MKFRVKRILALLLSLLLCMSVLPAARTAAKGDLRKELWKEIERLESGKESKLGLKTEQARAAAYAAHADEIEALVESSDAYVPDSMVRSGSFLSWRTADGVVNIYSPAERARLSAMTQRAEIKAGSSDEIPDFSDGTYSDVAVFQPFRGIDPNFGNLYVETASSLAETLGGESFCCEGTNCTIDRIAEAMTRFGVVLLDSHGDSDYYNSTTGDTTTYCNVNYLSLTSGAGITSQDMTYAQGPYGSYPHAGLVGYISGTNIEVWDVDGTVIANHMNGKAPGNLVWNGICMGMTTDAIVKPLRNKGVGVMAGYSKSVTFKADWEYLEAFLFWMKNGSTVKEAVANMRNEVGVYDPYSSDKAYPIVVSDMDAYPGRYYVNQKQNVTSTWKLIDIGGGLARPKITKQPDSVVGKIGETITIGATVQGTGLQYQWEYKKIGERTWTVWDGKTAPSFTVAISKTNHGCLYRCRIKNPAGRVCTETAQITAVDMPPIITKDLWGQTTIDAATPSTVAYIEAFGANLSYRWQVKRNGFRDWRDLELPNESGVLIPLGPAMHNAKVRCLVTNPSGTVSTTEELICLSRTPYLQIIRQPESVVTTLGSSAVFEVVGAGSSLSYLWQYRRAGEENWHNWSNQIYTDLIVTASGTNNGCEYRCLVTDERGTLTSESATLWIEDIAPVIVEQPDDAAAELGKQTAFRVEAFGGGLKYQWQYQKTGETVWHIWSGRTFPELSVTASETNDGCKYRCIVSNEGGSVISQSAVLSVLEPHECPGAAFTDMPPYGTTEHDAVDWAIEAGITTGTSATAFSPDKTVTRGQAVTFLWRACGSPEPETAENPFTDVKESSYCYKAVLWANENNITNGTSATTFAPNKTCSRGHILTFLYRQQGSPEVDESVIVPYTDVKEGAFYESAMKWAWANGIDKGVSETKFAPGADCTRLSTVLFLYRAVTGRGRLE